MSPAKLRQPIYLIPISQYARTPESASTSHLHDLHKKISKKINQRNAAYKVRANLHRKVKTFKVGDCDGSDSF